MTNEELLAKINELATGHAVVVVRIDGHEADIVEIKDNQKHMMRWMIAILASTVVTLATLLFGASLAG